MEKLPDNILFVRGDIRDRDSLTALFKEFRFSTVINLAGLKFPEESFEKKDEYFEVNAHAVASLLEISKHLKNMLGRFFVAAGHLLQHALLLLRIGALLFVLCLPVRLPALHISFRLQFFSNALSRMRAHLHIALQ